MCKILTLKTRLNSFIHINQLPSEILARILVAHAEDHYRSATGRWDKSVFTSPRWIKLAHVCRHWRDVALDTPRFWSFVYVRRPKTFHALLPLSKSAPLHIDLTLDPSIWSGAEAWKSATDLIGKQSHRLRELRFAATSNQVKMLAEKMGHSSMGWLEKLVLSHSNSKATDAGGSEPLQFLQPTTGRTPHLRHLEIRHLLVTWTDPVFCPTLTTLTVVAPKSSRNPATPIGTFEQFLDALRAMAPSLVDLKLEECMPRLLSTAEHSTSTRAIPLTSLQHLTISDTMGDCIRLLDHLCVNPTTTLNIFAIGVTETPRLVEILSAHVSRSTPLLALQIIFPQPTSSFVDITCHCNADLSLFRGRPAINLLLRTSPSDEAREQPLTAVLKASKTLFSRVQTLHLTAQNGLDVSWKRLFPRLYSVETLSISGDPGKGFFKALCNVRRVQKGQVWATFVPLRRLRKLDLDDVRFRNSLWGYERGAGEFFDQLRDWAILRCNYGVPLERLNIWECKYMDATDVTLLKQIIVEVEWDEWERGSTDEEDDDDDIFFDDDVYSY
ncbi:hypothetical protein GSI_12761 [Ganoderma sinense ZZ0214-1]|uniref:F-box domain-containing protein n=1 Tax=Ganoderma sinense ZZ0214-1 TaxID=1077348 RepID=A0A2G8RTR9_9APHY|nr:hypothetical protein GSI_12761 [Ganoderma sinense ZZ0214-1]